MAAAKPGKAASKAVQAAPLPPGAIQVPDALRKKLARLNLQTETDLLLHLPLRYEDETRLYMVADAPWGQAVQVEARVLTTEVQFRPPPAAGGPGRGRCRQRPVVALLQLLPEPAGGAGPRQAPAFLRRGAQRLLRGGDGPSPLCRGR